MHCGWVYHAVCMSMLSICTIAFEPHVVYFDGKHYWDSTADSAAEGPYMAADVGICSIVENLTKATRSTTWKTAITIA